MKVSVTDECIGCGMCVAICEPVFKLNDNFKSEVIPEADLEKNTDGINEAVKQCPVNCIIVKD